MAKCKHGNCKGGKKCCAVSTQFEPDNKYLSEYPFPRIQALADRFQSERGEMDGFERAAFQDLVSEALRLEKLVDVKQKHIL